MNNIGSVEILVFAAGLVLGTFFYGGLWWTVRRGLESRFAGWLFAISLWTRLGITAVGFYFVGQGDWKRYLTCFVGFIFARIAITILTRDPKSIQGENHAA